MSIDFKNIYTNDDAAAFRKYVWKDRVENNNNSKSNQIINRSEMGQLTFPIISHFEFLE